MKNERPRPKWFFFYLLSAAFVLLLFLEVKAQLSETGHVWAEIGLVLLFYGLIFSWLKSNERGMMMEDQERWERNHFNFQSASPTFSEQFRLKAQVPNKNANSDHPIPKNAWRFLLTWIFFTISSLGNFFRNLF
jgi:hypothetical protein